MQRCETGLTIFLRRSFAEDSGAVGHQAAPAEPMHTGEEDWIVQHPKADCTLVVLQDFCGLLALTSPSLQNI